MGNKDLEATSKPTKVPHSHEEQVSVHTYPDWRHMQAYYGPSVGIPPYLSSAVVPGHAPHSYMWGPQPMVPPFATTYQAIYAPGYHHPSLSLSPNAINQGTVSTTSNTEIAAMGAENPAKPPTKDSGLMKKRKGFNEFVASKGIDNCDDGGVSTNSPQSEEDLDGSSNGSEENSEGSSPTKKGSISADALSKGKEAKEGIDSRKADVSPTISLGVAVDCPSIVGKLLTVTPPLTNSKLDLVVSSISKTKSAAAPIPLTSSSVLPLRDTMPPEHWQDERELKREKRKQSNRESARRSRLRKQAETEELALKVENLTSEKVNLQEEINRLTEMSKKLRQDNLTLMGKLKMLEGVGSDSTLVEMDSKKMEIGCANLLSRLDNSNSTNMDGQQERETCESSSMKLHQLLEPSPRNNVLAAS